MSARKLTAPKGTHDLLGERALAQGTLESVARELLEGAGYERIETPALEATELFARGVGAATDIVQKEMYTLTDGGGRSLTLRPEGTAPVCRAYIEHGMHKRPQPVKLWYLSSFFRYERAQAGRYRQFWQVGAEALGSEDPALDAESIALLGGLLEAMGVSARLRLSSLGGLDSRAEYRERLQAHLRSHSGELSEEVRGRIELNPLRAFDSDHAGTRNVMASAPRLLEFLSAEDGEHFAEVRSLLDRAGVAYEVDSTLVRGLDYYTRTVFEFTSDALGAQSGVGGGGRYDGLIELIKSPATPEVPTPAPATSELPTPAPSTPGMGWAAGVERILLAGTAPAVQTRGLDLYVALTDINSPPQGGPSGPRTASRLSAFNVLCAARTAGMTAQMELAGRSLKGQLKQAERLGARHVAIVDGAETVLRDMRGGAERVVASEQAVESLLADTHEVQGTVQGST